MISSARPAKPPTRLPKRTPKVRRRPRISFSILTRIRDRHLADDQRGADLIAVPALYAHLLEPAGSHDLCQTGGVIAVRLHGAHLQGSVGVPGIDAQDRQPSCRKLIPEPNSHGHCFQTDPDEIRSLRGQVDCDRIRAGCYLLFREDASSFINDADRRRLFGNVQGCIGGHYCTPLYVGRADRC